MENKLNFNDLYEGATEFEDLSTDDEINILLKPSTLRDWVFVKETKRCIVIRKRGENSNNYVPKKFIQYITRI